MAATDLGRNTVWMALGLLAIGAATILGLQTGAGSAGPNGAYAAARAAPPDDGELRLSLSAGQGVVAPDADSAVVMAELVAPRVAEGARAPNAVALVLDTSSSMRGNKIVNARAAATFLVEQLAAGDRVGVVVFSTEAAVHVPLTEDAAGAAAAVASVEADGSTCISCGLELAYTMLAEAPPGSHKRVILLSDGRANGGLTDPNAFRWVARLAFERDRVTTSAIGLGRAYDLAAVGAIADGGLGGHYFVHNSRVIPTVLQRELDALGAVVMTDVAVELTPRADVQIGELAVGATQRQVIGLLTAGERRRVVARVALPAGALGDLVTATVHYRDRAGRQGSHTVALELARSPDRAAQRASRRPSVLIEQARRDAAGAIQRAIQLRGSGFHEAAARVLDEARAAIEASGAPEHPAIQLELEELATVAAELEQYGPGSLGLRVTGALNSARLAEVMRGVPAEASYHKNGMYDAAECE